MTLVPETAQRLTTRSASTSSRIDFPKGFFWGVSTAAHQVEGGNANNQWSLWEAAGKIKSGDACGVACDWWNSAEPDFDLAREMGLNALRLSVEWSRIEPKPGHWNLPALHRYREMLEGFTTGRVGAETGQRRVAGTTSIETFLRGLLSK